MKRWRLLWNLGVALVAAAASVEARADGARVTGPYAVALQPSPWQIEIPEDVRQASVSLAGSAWSGADDTGDLHVTFGSSGYLRGIVRGQAIGSGTWRQDGASVSFEMNGRWSEYRGTLVGDRMEGTAQDSAGRSWRWSLSRNP